VTNLASQTPQLTDDTMSVSAARFQTVVSNAIGRFKEKEKNFDSILNDARASLDATEQELRGNWDKKIHESIEKIEATNSAFTKQMQLHVRRQIN
jgi:hypothetical protein